MLNNFLQYFFTDLGNQQLTMSEEEE